MPSRTRRGLMTCLLLHGFRQNASFSFGGFSQTCMTAMTDSTLPTAGTVLPRERRITRIPSKRASSLRARASIGAKSSRGKQPESKDEGEKRVGKGHKTTENVCGGG
eukprot:399174-Pleurochrysis_carterae.AAC.1